MAASYSSRGKTRSSGPVLRSLSPCGRFYSPPSNSSMASSSAFASSTSSSFYSSGSKFFLSHDDHHSTNRNHSHYDNHRPSSPTRVNIYNQSSSKSRSVRFSIDHRSISPNRSIAVRNPPPVAKKTCMCSPTTHPGSFRCSLHKNMSSGGGGHSGGSSYPQNRLNMRRSAMTNSVVRIAGVEGEWVKRALTALIRPSSHQQRRRTAYRPARSRLSIMSRAGDI